jgi:hypothetical protein
MMAVHMKSPRVDGRTLYQDAVLYPFFILRPSKDGTSSAFGWLLVG